MRMLDLFSGIGGFSLAAQWVWGDDLEIVAFCEIDKFCQNVLRKHWPGVQIIEDIKKVEWVVANTKNTDGKECQRESPQIQFGRGNIRSIDLLTGGFPCQPFSCAGKRAGTEDDRFLWPEMLRAIHEVKPRWVVAENVPGILSLDNGLVFEGVCTDLEAEGYEVIPLVIPACAVGAPHRRDRVWIVANSRCFRQEKHEQQSTGVEQSDCHASHSIGTGTRGKCREASDQRRGTSQNMREGIRQENGQACTSGTTPTDCHAPDTTSLRCQSRKWMGNGKRVGQKQKGSHSSESSWQEHWYEVATRFCRVDDGVRNRVDRLKSLGNAIVPQVVEQIFRAIKEICKKT